MANTAGSNNSSNNDGIPIIFGEVLFDEFEDGSSILGGAPFNVAWHLQGFGLNPLVITRIGQDKHGEQVLRTMQRWNMNTQGVQQDAGHPTGRVTIRLDRGQPTFNILPEQAYDFIEYEPALTAFQAHSSALLYHGSLIARNSVSHSTLNSLRTHATLPVFVDVNLRNPWWKDDLIKSILHGAHWAKLNDDELEKVAKFLHGPEQLVPAAQAVRSHFNLELLVVTLGAQGAYFITDGQTQFAKPVAVKNMMDTVGAGDAFSAVTIVGLIRNWPIELVQQRAMEFASAICEIRGATTENKLLYQQFMDKWGE